MLRRLFSCAICALFICSCDLDVGTGTANSVTGIPVPVISGEKSTLDLTPTWSWTESDDYVSFRYKINDGDWTEISVAAYTPPSELAAGIYTIYVQALGIDGNWTAAAEFNTGVKVWLGDYTISDQDCIDCIKFYDEIDGSCTVTGGASLFSGVLEVREINGDLVIDNNSFLTNSLDCFDSLISIKGDLRITNNNSLDNVDLPELQTIEGGITIEGNILLYFDPGALTITNLFPAVTSINGALIRIWNNSNISNAEAQDFVDELTNAGVFSGGSEIGP